MKRSLKGSITVFLCMVILLVVALIVGLLDAASLQVAKNYGRADGDIGMESIFAEYDKKLLENYKIFGIEGSYGGKTIPEEGVLDRLDYYVNTSSMTEYQVEEISYLTDNQGIEFYRQAAEYIKSKYGLTYVDQYLPNMGSWDGLVEESKKQEKEMGLVEQEIELNLDETEQELASVDNPISKMEAAKKLGILNLVLPDSEQVSTRAVDKTQLPSARSLRQGSKEFTHNKIDTGLTGKLLFVQYLFGHFTHAAKEQKETGLAYELEYILQGKASDRENLEGTANQLLMIRMVPNYIKLQNDTVKQGEAEVLALSIATTLLLPHISPLIKQGILVAWSFDNSVEDVKTLLSGGKVALIGEGKEFSYEDYLRMLLFLQSKEILTMRSLDVIEIAINSESNTMKLDDVVTGLKIYTTCVFRRNIQYKFMTQYQYQ